jgi:hypothetical protein
MKRLSSGLRVGLAMAVCAALLAPSALADNGKKPPGDQPGNSANAPGQEKREEVPPPQPVAPVQPSEAAPAETAAPAASDPAAAKEVEPAAPAVTAPPAKPGKPEGAQVAKPEQTKPESQPRTGAAPRPHAASDRAAESTAHSKVLICHATGSATNPYVLISVSVNAWSKGSGHGAHKDDVFVDWSWPGDPRQKNDALCPQTGPVGTTTTAGTGTTTSSSSGSPPPDAPGSDAVQSASTPQTAEGEPLGPTMAPPVARAVERPAADVLTTGAGVAGTAVRGTLPFTGLPIWAIALAALGLIALGLTLRRGPARATTS